jgi:hypothetical protein
MSARSWPPARKASRLATGPGLRDFIKSTGGKSSPQSLKVTPVEAHPYINEESMLGHGRSVYLDVHGCQMNVSDAEVVWSVLQSKGYSRTLDRSSADVWLIVTCSIREGAESKIFKKIDCIKRGRKANSLR